MAPLYALSHLTYLRSVHCGHLISTSANPPCSCFISHNCASLARGRAAHSFSDRMAVLSPVHQRPSTANDARPFWFWLCTIFSICIVPFERFVRKAKGGTGCVATPDSPKSENVCPIKQQDEDNHPVTLPLGASTQATSSGRWFEFQCERSGRIGGARYLHLQNNARTDLNNRS